MYPVPGNLASNVIDVHGDRGRAWLDHLGDLVSSIEERWRIKVGAALGRLNYNLIAPVTLADGTEAILKTGVPGSHFDNEVTCLQYFAGDGSVKLLDHDASVAAMLLERVRPGSDVKDLDEKAAVKAAVHVMTRLHKPLDHVNTSLPSVQDWGRGFQRFRRWLDGGTGPLPDSIVDEAEKVFLDLTGSMGRTVLLHGDLHHENILSSNRTGWLAIDPQGVVGEPEYETGAFLRNPIPQIADRSDLQEITEIRVMMFSELTGCDPDRIYGWGFSQAVLSAIWSIEDHGRGWEQGLHIAEAIRAASR
jgi:streptomycin 6-kinase